MTAEARPGIDIAEQIAVEDDYRICVKRKGEDKEKSRRGREKAGELNRPQGCWYNETGFQREINMRILI